MTDYFRIADVDRVQSAIIDDSEPRCVALAPQVTRLVLESPDEVTAEATVRAYLDAWMVEWSQEAAVRLRSQIADVDPELLEHCLQSVREWGLERLRGAS